MKRFFATMAAFIAMSVAAAQAADMRPVVKAPPAPIASVYNWSGFYVGAQAGWGWAKNRFHDVASGVDSADFVADGWLLGGQLGYNWQSGAWVFGIEGDASADHIRKGVFGGFCQFGGLGGGCRPCGFWFGQFGGCTAGCVSQFGQTFCGGQLGARIQEMATLTGRIGHAWGPWLAYAKGGVAYAHEHYVFNTLGVLNTIQDGDRWGWTVGAGVEYGFTGNWSVKVEYNFIDFGTERLTFVAPGGATFAFDHAQQVHLAKFGINYRFAPGPVVARY